MGRPSSFTQAAADEICRKISEGFSLREISSQGLAPSKECIREWLLKYPDFAAQYARAREEQAEFYADEIIAIADACEDPHKARLQIDARKWKASKLAPKKYGDKIDVEHSGSVEIEVVIGGDVR